MLAVGQRDSGAKELLNCRSSQLLCGWWLMVQGDRELTMNRQRPEVVNGILVQVRLHHKLEVQEGSSGLFMIHGNSTAHQPWLLKACQAPLAKSRNK